MNSLVALIDPITHKIWYNIIEFRYIYWLVVVFLVIKVGKYAWEYITPSYETGDEENGSGKKEKK